MPNRRGAEDGKQTASIVAFTARGVPPEKADAFTCLAIVGGVAMVVCTIRAFTSIERRPAMDL